MRFIVFANRNVLNFCSVNYVSVIFVFVTKSHGGICNVSVAAVTGICCVTTLCASRSSYNCFIGVTLRSKIEEGIINKILISLSIYAGNECLFAVTASDCDVAVFSTSSACYNEVVIAVSCSRNCNSLSGELCIANSTVNYVIVRACSCASRINIVFNNNLAAGMTESGNDCCGSANLCITYSTVNYCFVRACRCTSSINVIFDNCISLHVTLCRNLICFVSVAANGALISGVTVGGTSRISNNSIILVTKRVNCNSLSGNFLFANSTANYVIVFTCIYAIGSNVVFNNNLAIGVTESIGVICNVSIATNGASISCITAVFAIGLSYNCIVGVTLRRNNILCNKNLVTYGAMRACCETCSCASRFNRRISNDCMSAYCVNVTILNRVVAISKLVGVIAVICMVSGVEVMECTAVNGDSTKLFSLVNVEEVSVAEIVFSSREFTVENFDFATSCSVDTCATVRFECTVNDCNLCAIGSGNYASRFAVTCASHFTVTCDSNNNACAICPKNVNNAIFIVPSRVDCIACKVNNNVHSLGEVEVTCKCDVLFKSYAVTVCKSRSKERFIAYVNNFGSRNVLGLLVFCIVAANRNVLDSTVNYLVCEFAPSVTGSLCLVCNVGMVASGASVCCVTCSLTSRSSYNGIVGVSKSANCCCLSGELSGTNSTVNYCIVGACRCASSSNIVFNYRIACLVTKSTDYTIGCVIASCTCYVSITAVFCTSSIMTLVRNLIVTESRCIVILVSVTACASVGCITACSTCRSSYNSIVSVIKLGIYILLRISSIASVALSGLSTVSCASCIAVRNVVCEGVIKLCTLCCVTKYTSHRIFASSFFVDMIVNFFRPFSICSAPTGDSVECYS